MEEREFAKYAFLIVAVVAVVGLLTMGDGITGFAAKKSYSKKPMIQKYAQPAAATAGDAGYPPEAKAKAAAQVRTPRRDSCRDNERSRRNTTHDNLPFSDIIAGNVSFYNASDGSTRIINDICGAPAHPGVTNVWEVGCSADGRTHIVIRNYRCPSGCVDYHNGACNP